MEDFGQLNIKHSESLTSGLLMCTNIPLLKRTLERIIEAVQKYMLKFFNCSVKIGYIFTIERHCSLQVKVVPVSFSFQAMIELSFVNLIDLISKLWKTIYNLLQQLPTYLELHKEYNR